MSERITENLRIMDSLLDLRKVEVSSIEATKSADGSKTALDAFYELSELEMKFRKEQ